LDMEEEAREHWVKTVYKELMDKGTQKHFLDELMTRRKFYKLINYDEYEEMDRELSRI